MKSINEVYIKPNRTERIIQFGEGGFLRGFFDWMLEKCNNAGVYDGSAVVVQPIERGLCDKLSEQNCLYTNIIRGVEGVEQDVITSISRCVNPYEDYNAFLELAENKDAKIVVSNTTESGIVYEYVEYNEKSVPKTFPAKVTALLKKRFECGLEGFIFLPCELIEANGTNLKTCVLKHAADWNLGEDFISFVENDNIFCNTLVDRIVTGYPRDEKIDLPYIDNMVNTAEYYHLWVIESDRDVSALLPFKKAGLNVVYTDNLTNYRSRKVRILNGAHTSTVAFAMLNNIETVKDAMENDLTKSHLETAVFDEIIPTLTLPIEELKDYANSVLTRFKNPYIRHFWRSISLNSVSKFKVRVLPSLLEYHSKFGKAPERLTFALACLIKLYKTMEIDDDAEVIEKMKSGSIEEILADKALWGEDISFLLAEVSKYDNN
ncbi:MAG: tagaturonate reductase [Clostridia bacterium]|nr:tagaturonate reductase [Clostridia bacterium]